MKLRLGAYILSIGFCVLFGFQAASQSPATKPEAKPVAQPKQLIVQSGGFLVDEYALEEQLEKVVSINAKENTLEEVMEQFAYHLRISIVFDPVGLDDAGVTRDQPVTLNVRNVRARSALKLLLRPLNLTTILKDDIFQVTSVERCSEQLITKVYNCRDILTWSIPLRGGFGMRQETGGFSGPLPVGCETKVNDGESDTSTSDEKIESLENRIQSLEIALSPTNDTPEKEPDSYTLIDTITSSIAPELWIDNGGRGTITGYGNSGLLVISQTVEIHKEVEQLLNQIREHLPQQEPAEENE
jgi:hypothetical protein